MLFKGTIKGSDKGTAKGSTKEWTGDKEALRMKKTKPTKPPSDEYQRFENLARQIISVPKSEIDRRQAQYEKARKAAKKTKAA